MIVGTIVDFNIIVVTFSIEGAEGESNTSTRGGRNGPAGVYIIIITVTSKLTFRLRQGGSSGSRTTSYGRRSNGIVVGSKSIKSNRSIRSKSDVETIGSGAKRGWETGTG